MIAHIATSVLDIAYETGGPEDGPPLLLLHGWPDDVRTFDKIVPALQAAGFRTVAPFLRGFGETTFLSPKTPRSGQIAALAQDALDLMDALKHARFAILGHDWGARAAYLLAAVFPERVTRIAALSVPWQPGPLPTPGFEQAAHFWYQWFLATARGAAAIRDDGKAFARYQWETWGPEKWFSDAEFEATAVSFANPDWPAVTLHSYRVRWGEAERDPRYKALEESALRALSIPVPVLMLQGGTDRCVLPSSSEGKERFFTSAYRREVLPGIGHFPTREAPEAVSRSLLAFFKG